MKISTCKGKKTFISVKVYLHQWLLMVERVVGKPLPLIISDANYIIINNCTTRAVKLVYFIKLIIVLQIMYHRTYNIYYKLQRNP